MNIQFGDHQIPFLPWRPEYGQVFTDPFALDTETLLIDDNHPWIPPAFVLGAACDGHNGYFLTKQHVLPFLQAHADVPVVFHNAPFDLEVLQLVVGPQLDLYDLVDQNLVWDTNLLHRLLVLGRDGNTARGKGESTLEKCVKTYLDLELPKDVQDADGVPVRLSYHKWLNKPPGEIPQVYLEYLAKDVLATILVYHELRAELDDLLAGSSSAFGFISKEWLDEQIERWGPQTHHIQLKGAVVLRAITANGLHVDMEALERLRPGLEAKREELLSQLRSYGYLPGTGSKKALQAILGRLEKEQPGLVLPRKATGKIGSSKEALEELRGEPFVDALLEYNAINKLLETYLDKLSKQVLHPSFNPLLESGRTSAYGDINSQNLPRDGHVRECIIPSPGFKFVDADYRTLELATLAQSVQDMLGIESRMGELINDGVDLHLAVASQITGKPIEESKRERSLGKVANFGKCGGMGTKGLIRFARVGYGLKLSEDDAQAIEAGWFAQFPEMEKYLNLRVDSGLELAWILGLTPEAYEEATGSRRFSWIDARDEPCGALGGMCLKVVKEDRPSTGKGRIYEPAEIEFFWDRLNDSLDSLPKYTHEGIRCRRPSFDLGNRLWRFAGLAPVVTTTGRLRAKAGYCQQKNTPFQGLAADGAKLALWRLHRADYRIVNFIHDEVLIEVPDQENAELKARDICRLMREAMHEVVPDIQIEVESGISDRWVKPEAAPAVTACAA